MVKSIATTGFGAQQKRWGEWDADMDEAIVSTEAPRNYNDVPLTIQRCDRRSSGSNSSSPCCLVEWTGF